MATCRFLKLILLLTKLPNYNELEANSMRMNYNLHKGPELQQIYHYFHKVKYIGENYMITFEDMFDTRFWDTKEELFFTRHTPSPLARYEANFTNKTLKKCVQVSIRNANTQGWCRGRHQEQEGGGNVNSASWWAQKRDGLKQKQEGSKLKDQWRNKGSKHQQKEK